MSSQHTHKRASKHAEKRRGKRARAHTHTHTHTHAHTLTPHANRNHFEKGPATAFLWEFVGRETEKTMARGREMMEYRWGSSSRGWGLGLLGVVDRKRAAEERADSEGERETREEGRRDGCVYDDDNDFKGWERESHSKIHDDRQKSEASIYIYIYLYHPSPQRRQKRDNGPVNRASEGGKDGRKVKRTGKEGTDSELHVAREGNSRRQGGWARTGPRGRAGEESAPARRDPSHDHDNRAPANARRQAARQEEKKRKKKQQRQQADPRKNKTALVGSFRFVSL